MTTFPSHLHESPILTSTAKFTCRAPHSSRDFKRRRKRRHGKCSFFSRGNLRDSPSSWKVICPGNNEDTSIIWVNGEKKSRFQSTNHLLWNWFHFEGYFQYFAKPLLGWGFFRPNGWLVVNGGVLLCKEHSSERGCYLGVYIPPLEELSHKRLRLTWKK